MNTVAQYTTYIKPSFAPPSWIFGPVWSVLYVIIAISFGYVLYACWKKKLPWKTFLPFGLNLLFNFAYTPIQFGLQNNILASIDIVLVLTTLIWSLCSIWKKHRWVTLANVPYLLWVSFATVLQLTITYLNR